MLSFEYSNHIGPLVGPALPRPRERGRVAETAFLKVCQAGHFWAIMFLVLALTTPPSLAIDVRSAGGALSLVNRSVTQDQGAWVVDYRLRYTGKTGVIITPEKIAAKIEGWVSNSRVAEPCFATVVITDRLTWP